MTDSKYVVYKREALDDLLVAMADKLTPSVGEALNNFVSAAIDDAVVIRRQDVFAPPALDAYANSIAVALSLISSDEANVEIKERLRGIADYFHDQATQAWQADRKLPD